MGNQTSVTDANHNTTQYAYDDDNRLTTTTYPDNTFSALTYNEIGQKVAQRDQDGRVTQYDYGPLTE
jgi:YD repeat-containing protein